MKVDAFDFDLPADRIAQYPVHPRDAARLLHVAGTGQPTDRSVADLPKMLQAGDVMVFNDTRVIPSRLEGKRFKPGDTGQGARVQVTLHKRHAPGVWDAFAKPAKKLSEGSRIHFADDVEAQVLNMGRDGEVRLDFECHDDEMMATLDRIGIMPLPPYIQRSAAGEAEDRDNYQTVYAAAPGAVAAPTAGLHFTDELLGAIDKAAIHRETLTLHVGAGTFLPVKAADTENHRMHHEWGEITATTADRLNAVRRNGGRIVAVGTTALRLLESAADENGTIHPFSGETDIFITPGYRFRAVDLLMTNFHLPKSTLFMLVSAFSGLNTMKAAYAHAIAKGYRFYSYGDACLLEPGT